MKFLLSILLSFCLSGLSTAQSTLEKSVPVNSGDEVRLEFKWPELIRVHTWEKSEVKIVAKVEINKGQNDDAFMINVENSGKNMVIASTINDYENLPKKIMIKKDGQEYFFNTDNRDNEEYKAFKKENGINGYSYSFYGVIVDVTIEVWAPESIALEVYSKFGLIEIKNYSSSLKVNSKFGGIDLTTSGSVPVKAGTKFGQKYTNLTSTIKALTVGSGYGKWDWVQLGNQTEALQELKSEFGNIYIRSL